MRRVPGALTGSTFGSRPRGPASVSWPRRRGRDIRILCTPRGERFNLKLYGWAPGHIWRGMDEGQEFILQVFRHPPFSLSTNAMVAPPRLEFEGHWHGPDLVMDDQSTFAEAFNPDGTLNPNPKEWHRAANEVPITFTEQYWGFIGAPACSPLSRR